MDAVKYAIYILVVEDTNRMAEEIAGLGASSVLSINDIETEYEAIEKAEEMKAEAKDW